MPPSAFRIRNPHNLPINAVLDELADHATQEAFRKLTPPQKTPHQHPASQKADPHNPAKRETLKRLANGEGAITAPRRSSQDSNDTKWVLPLSSPHPAPDCASQSGSTNSTNHS
jgi:hypothetical protein